MACSHFSDNASVSAQTRLRLLPAKFVGVWRAIIDPPSTSVQTSGTSVTYATHDDMHAGNDGQRQAI
jgi:hypothetical protein